jgi:tetratricopeptide (TPR) repeat protein
MNAPRDIRGIIVEQQLDRIFEAVIVSDVPDVDDLFRQLDHFQASAERIDENYLRACAYSVRATALLLTQFRLGEAEAEYQRALTCYSAAGSERAIGMEANLALVRLHRADYSGAADWFEALLEQLPPESPRHSDLSLNTALSLLPLFRWDEALKLLLPLLEHYGEKLATMRNYGHGDTLIIEHRVALGMAQLGAGLVQQAIDSARLAMEFIVHIHSRYTHALALCLMLRMVLSRHIHEDQSRLLSQLARITQPTADLYTFCLLRDEARYYTWRGIAPDVVAWLVKRARAIADAHASRELHASIDLALTV